MKSIRLWEMYGANLIYPTTSGILLSNQVGGGACFQSQLEGFILPIEQQFSPNNVWLSELELALYQIFENCAQIDIDMANAFDQLMQSSVTTNFIRINRDKLTDSCEAWLHVHVCESEFATFHGFGNFEGVLTWHNSD
ncbi:MAG: DUF6210 family protein [Psychrobacter sp.]|nr:DUF6210 family protein [Psychrobacter sp.]